MGSNSVRLLFPLLSVALIACSGGASQQGAAPTNAPATTATQPTDVPAQFETLYSELRDRLDKAHAAFSAPAPPTDRPPALVVELLSANGNRGDDLLRPDTLDTTRIFLDRFREIGAAGVSIQIVYPLLGKDYPRSDEYLNFYRSVADEVRKRGFTLIIATGAPFAGTEFSPLHIDYTGKTPQSYLQERLKQAAIIADVLQPDYLTLSEEQSTERMLTGLDITTEDYLEFLRSARAVVDPPAGVKLGAGSGSWESPALVQQLIRDSPLDFIDIHVYPLSNGIVDYLQITSDWASQAVAAGKEAVIGEAWLYKASVEELVAGTGFQTLFGRDVYSFWQPLDAEFIDTIVDMASVARIHYVSFFWSRYLFGYVDYDDVPAGTAGVALQQAANLASWTALTRNELSATGEEFKRLASSSP